MTVNNILFSFLTPIEVEALALDLLPHVHECHRNFGFCRGDCCEDSRFSFFLTGCCWLRGSPLSSGNAFSKARG